MTAVMVAGGRISGGKSDMIFDRNHFAEEGLKRHITENELARISGHLNHLDRISEAEMEGYGLHVRNCKPCADRIHSLPPIVLDAESIHTSGQPNAVDEISDLPDIRDISDWDEVGQAQFAH
jgi:hypothetical protein